MSLSRLSPPAIHPVLSFDVDRRQCSLLITREDHELLINGSTFGTGSWETRHGCQGLGAGLDEAIA